MQYLLSIIKPVQTRGFGTLNINAILKADKCFHVLITGSLSPGDELL